MSAWLDFAGVPFSQHWIDAGPVRTRVIEAGSGEPLLLLHGTAGHAEAYTRNMAAHAEHFRVLAVDMLGHGYTDRPDHPYEVESYVTHLLDLIDALGVERVHLSGESLGGWVAAWLASEHPDRVGKLLLNTPGGATADENVLERLRGLTRNAIADPTPETVRARLEWLMADPATVTDELVAIRRAIYDRPEFQANVDNLLTLLDLEPRRRNLLTEERLAAVQAPTQIVWTTHDPMADVPVGEWFERSIPDARLTVMRECGHWPQFENAPEFNDISLRFLLGE
ncbi:MAG: hsaD 3 [Solirubrobacterales bacterium]|jgi:2-hydroxy-6-oxonona-2,4-dienedioate hydrolase|nr:hsaD 3 [Solirubrobacterales bacterium]